MKNYQTLARAAGAYHRCISSGNTEWEAKHKAIIDQVVRDHFPHGAGFDNGTKLSLDESSDDELVFETAFHHMNEGGMYDGWTEHRVRVKPSLGLDYRLTISGRDRNQIKEYIAEIFGIALSLDPDLETAKQD